MPYYLYLSAQNDDKLSVFTMDAGTGKLTPKLEVPVPGGPAILAISPNRDVLYVGHRTDPRISSWRIDHGTGGLTQTGAVTPVEGPSFLFTDRKGRYMLSAYYQSGIAAVHPLGNNGEVGGPPIESLETGAGAQAIQTDPSNKFAFVPHIALLSDETLGANSISQFKFDEITGHLTPNSPPQVEPEERLGPRHFCFHPTKDIVYTSNEQGSSVTAYRFDTSAGTLSAFQTISSVPNGYTGENSCSQIQFTASGKFLYVPNRGHDSIAGFSVDASTGRLTAIGQVLTEHHANCFSLDPEGKFVFAPGLDTNRLASYRIDGDKGQLTPLETYSVGRRPRWVLITKFGD